MISGFTFVHNALSVGIPIRESINAVLPYVDELLVVDAQSTDGTKELVNNMVNVRVIHTDWGTDAGETLARLHALHTECKYDTILHFEADEVYDYFLLNRIKSQLHHKSLAVYRIQVEQNFQRVRWYSELVHRVFKKGTVKKVGHTTDKHDEAFAVNPEFGLLWDVTNCFRDNYMDRIQQQAKLWNGEPNQSFVPIHFKHSTIDYPDNFLDQPHWTFKTTPLDIPEILKPLVGKTKYES